MFWLFSAHVLPVVKYFEFWTSTLPMYKVNKSYSGIWAGVQGRISGPKGELWTKTVKWNSHLLSPRPGVSRQMLAKLTVKPQAQSLWSKPKNTMGRGFQHVLLWSKMSPTHRQPALRMHGAGRTGHFCPQSKSWPFALRILIEYVFGLCSSLKCFSGSTCPLKICLFSRHTYQQEENKNVFMT